TMPSWGWSAGTWAMGTSSSSAVAQAPNKLGADTAAPSSPMTAMRMIRRRVRDAVHCIRDADTSGVLRRGNGRRGGARPGAESDPAARVGRAGGYRVWEPGAEAGASTWERG